MATPGECFFNLFLSQAEVRKLMGKFLFIVLFTHVVVSIYMKIATVGAREIFFSLPSLKNWCLTDAANDALIVSRVDI